MSSGSPTASGLPATPEKDDISATSSADDTTPSRLEILRAKVHNSRHKAAVRKNRIAQNGSPDGNASSSSLRPEETKPLHIQQEQEWKDVISGLEKDKEALQNELAQMKQILEAKASETKEQPDSASATVAWEERYQALEAIHKALKEQCERDDAAKKDLSRLCESLEKQLEAEDTEVDSMQSRLARVSKDLREAQARESILHVELESLQASNEQLTKSANETQAILEKELKDSRLQHQKLSADMQELTIVEENTPRTQVGGSDLALKEQVKELQQIIDAWKNDSSSNNVPNTARKLVISEDGEDATYHQTSDAADRKRFAALGDLVLRDLQGKVQTLQSVVTTQMMFRRKLERRVNQLLKQVQELRREKSSGANRLDRESLQRLSLQLVDGGSTGYAALEAQVAVLQQDLDEMTEAKEQLAKNVKEQELSLKQALERNDSLEAQVTQLETKITNLKSSPQDSNSSLDSANEMELLMELQSVRDQMDKVTEESKKLQSLLNHETKRSSELTQQVEDLKKKVQELEVSNKSSARSEDEQVEGPMVLKKMKMLQEQTDQLIDETIRSNKDGNAKVDAAKQDETMDVPTLLAELKDIRDKVHSHIEILERAQSAAAKSQAASRIARQRKPGEMDIRITNEMTGRQTDLFVVASADLNMYDGIYNSKAVKSANIRKWPTEIMQASKEKKIEVQSVLLDSQGNGIKMFSVKELRQCSTKDFLSLAADPFGKIKLILRCRNIKEVDSKILKSIRVSNEVTGRIKDILVPISAIANLYDTIYNHDIVRTANIRKWPNYVCQQVAQKTHSIYCAVMSQGKERKMYSVEELKNISTDQLVNLAESPMDIIQLVLKCKDDGTNETPMDHDKKPSSTRRKPYIRTNVKNVATGRSLDFEIPESDQLTLFDGLYENEALRRGKIRLWPDRMAEKVKAGEAEIKCALIDTNGSFLRTFSIAELKKVNTGDLAGLATKPQDVYSFLLWSEATADSPPPMSAAVIESPFRSTGFRQRGWTQKDESAAQIHIRIINQETKRSKDLLVPISPDVNMFDGIYSNASVLAANIRKWPQSVREAVKQNTSEIKVTLLNGDKEIRAFSVEELKSVSIAQLLDLVSGKQTRALNIQELKSLHIGEFPDPVPEKDNLVLLVLNCQQTPAVRIRELTGRVEELSAQKMSLEGALQTMKLEGEAALEEAEQRAREHKASVSAITTELATMVARGELSKLTFDETKAELKAALGQKKKEAEHAKARAVKLEKDLKSSNSQNSELSSLEISKLKAQITTLEQEKEKLLGLVNNSPLKDELKELKSKLQEADARETNLKEDLEMYKKRLHKELIGATASESSVTAELKSLKRSIKVELDAAQQKESELKNEILSYKDKLQQERHMLSCLSTELYDCLYREAELRAEVEQMDLNPKHDTIHTEETAVLIKAEYAGVAPDETVLKDLDSARNLNEALSKQVVDLESKMKKIEEANSTKEKEYQQIKDRDEEMKASVNSLTSILEQTTETNKALSSRVEELEAMCARLEKQNEEATSRAAVAEEKSNEHSGILAQVDELKSKLEHAVADKERLLNLVERKESLIENLRVDGADVGEQARSKDVLQMLEKSHDREKKLQMQYHVCVSELEKLTDSTKAYQKTTDAKLSETQKDVEEQRYANKLFKGIIAKLNQMNESLEDKNEKQSQELENLRSKQQELSDSGLEDMQNLNKHLSEEVNFLREQKSKFNKMVSKLQGQLNELSRLRTEGDMDRKRLEAVISEMEEEKVQSLERDKQFDATVAKASKLASQLKEEQELRNSEAAAAKKKQAKLSEQVELLTSQLQEVTKKLGDPLRSENTDVLITKLREAEAKNKRLRKERGSLQKELDAVNARMAEIKREIGSIGL